MFAFDGILLVADLDRVDDEAVAELVASATRDTGSIYRAMDSKIQIAGNGYQVQLPPAVDAGFELGDRAGYHPAPGLLVITAGDGRGLVTRVGWPPLSSTSAALRLVDSVNVD